MQHVRIEHEHVVSAPIFKSADRRIPSTVITHLAAVTEAVLEHGKGVRSHAHMLKRREGSVREHHALTMRRFNGHVSTNGQFRPRPDESAHRG